MKSVRFASLLALAPMLALAACGKSGEDEGAKPSTAAVETAPGLAVTGGKLVLPAVSGNPAGVYFTLANNGDKPVVLAAVDVAGAKMAMLHETKQEGGHSTMAMLENVAVEAKGSVAFAPGGKHVMVEGLPEGLKAGGSIEMTLTFASGDKLSAPLAIEAPGGM